MMKRILILLLSLLLAAAAGCASRKSFEAATPAPAPTATAKPTEAPAPEPTEAPTEEPTAEPTEEPTAEPTEEPGGRYCTMDGIELTRPTEDKLWTPVFENITFLINGELMDSSQELAPDECILTAHCTVVASEDCETEWTLVLRYNDADYLTRTARVTLYAGENDVLIVIRADEPFTPGDYVVKLYEEDVFLGGTDLVF
ncbi:MAG: hypothetical protein IJJ86_06610 [Clostridia bacterium]|nr:hypothetical protein [Clostridia bacterium]